jgi:NADH:ubiquinone oxidoreductase subunit 6 (subunit J)
MKWLYVGAVAGIWLFGVGGVVLAAALTPEGGAASDGAAVASMLPLMAVVFFILAVVAAMVWLHSAWSSVPEQMRYMDSGKWITPGQAVGYCFIPFYNLYWFFMASIGLCEAINRTMVAQGKPPKAPKGLAIASSVAQVVPYCNYLVAPILWTVFMFMVDGARREMNSQGG